MNIKKEYEKFFERKKNDLYVHDAEDVISFDEHYQALQLQQTGVIKSVCDNCERKKLYIKKQCYCSYCGNRLKT